MSLSVPGLFKGPCGLFGHRLKLLCLYRVKWELGSHISAKASVSVSHNMFVKSLPSMVLGKAGDTNGAANVIFKGSSYFMDTESMP